MWGGGENQICKALDKKALMYSLVYKILKTQMYHENPFCRVKSYVKWDNAVYGEAALNNARIEESKRS